MRLERQLVLYSIPFLLFLVVSSLVPLLFILAKSFQGGLRLWESVFTGAPSLALPGWNVGLSLTLLWLPMARSIVVGIGATVLSVCLGTVFAVLVATSNLRYKRAFVYCQVLQFVIPPLTIAQFWVVISELLRFPPSLAEGPVPMVLVLGFHFQSLVFLIVNASLRRLDQTVVDAARVGGAGYAGIVRRIVLPLATPAIVTSTALSLFFNISAFTPVYLLGTGSSPYYTLPMQIYSVYLGSFLSPVSTSVMLILALVLTSIALIPFLFYLNSTRRWSVRTLDWNRERQMFSLGSAAGPLSAVVLLFGLLSVTTPLIFLLLQSVNIPTLGGLASQVSFAAVRQVLSSGAVASSISSTIILGTTASAACVAMSFVMSYLSVRMKEKPVGFLIYLLAVVPFLVPAAALGTAYLTAVTSTAALQWLFGTIYLVILVNVVIHFGLGLQVGTAAINQVNASQEEAAFASGASVWRTLRRVVLPLTSSSLLAGWIVIFAFVTKEVDTLMFLYPPLSVGSGLTLNSVLHSPPLMFLAFTYLNANDPSLYAQGNFMLAVFTVVIMGIILLASRLGGARIDELFVGGQR